MTKAKPELTRDCRKALCLLVDLQAVDRLHAVGPSDPGMETFNVAAGLHLARLGLVITANDRSRSMGGPVFWLTNDGAQAVGQLEAA